MANTPSARKVVRKIITRTKINQSRRSRVRTFIRKFEDALRYSDKVAAQDSFRLLEPEVMRAVNKGVIHRNNAARKISRLSKRLRAFCALP
ncbi:MAG: small subunit ribosomal protein S20 [Candidatus Tokpelaia sp. JSC085]|nr:MAG: small subunit ribosomal protein S20 [Candidatus Tokpelaia sp. JSC085]